MSEEASAFATIGVLRLAVSMMVRRQKKNSNFIRAKPMKIRILSRIAATENIASVRGFESKCHGSVIPLWG
jgi:hypothetical protein